MTGGGDLDLRHPDFEVRGVRWHPTGLEITEALSYEDAESIAFVLGATIEASRFGLADLMDYADRRWGESKLSQLAVATRRSEHTLQNICWVARSVPREIRNPRLTYSHHEAVAGIADIEAKRRWLHFAEQYRLTVIELRAYVQAAKGPDVGTALPDVGKTPMSSVIEAKPARPAKDARLREVAREITWLPADLDGRVCLDSEILAKLRAALAEAEAKS